MALEAANTINQLREEYPTGLDPKSQGDDHIRLIKGAVKRTFPAITGVVTVTHEQINKIADTTQYVQSGMVMLWPYSVATIPTGWRLCNGVGEISGGRAVPNLLGRFPVGATDEIPLGSIGGSATHTHTVTVAAHALTIEEMPSHTHDTNTGGIYTFAGNDLQGVTRGAGKTLAAGGSQPHSHGGSVTGGGSLPPFFSLHFIIKV